MIYAYSVISGYISLRGNFSVHFPMFVAMLIFVNPYKADQLPDNEDLDWATPGGRLWAIYGLWIHLILGLLHFMVLLNMPESTEVFRLVVQIIGVIG